MAAQIAQIAQAIPIKNPGGKTFSRAEVAKHNKKGDLWLVVDTAVYNLSKFPHPGGEGVLVRRFPFHALCDGRRRLLTFRKLANSTMSR